MTLSILSLKAALKKLDMKTNNVKPTNSQEPADPNLKLLQKQLCSATEPCSTSLSLLKLFESLAMMPNAQFTTIVSTLYFNKVFPQRKKHPKTPLKPSSPTMPPMAIL